MTDQPLQIPTAEELPLPADTPPDLAPLIREFSACQAFLESVGLNLHAVSILNDCRYQALVKVVTERAAKLDASPSATPDGIAKAAAELTTQIEADALEGANRSLLEAVDAIKAETTRSQLLVADADLFAFKAGKNQEIRP